MSITVVPQNARESTLLKSSYFCKVDRRRKVDVVLQLSTSSKTNKNTVSFRYVLVIDVSGSMGSTIQNTNICLLDRIKIFAETFVENMNDMSWLSIVTFSNKATTCMKMTRMDRNGRTAAKKIIESLKAGGGTNISDGLFEGLRTTSGGGRETRDCIILFTDGAANNGIVVADQLVVKYNELLSKLGKQSRVPISAFTIGDYRPYLLREISTRLGCEAFYWLNEDCDFEADLFAPMCLRESTTITDISVTLTCLEGVAFSICDVSTQYLESDLKAKPSMWNLSYFIHSIPISMKKHICISLLLPPGSNLDAKQILRVEKTFLDFESSQQTSTDHLELRLKSMNDITSSSMKEWSKQAVEILRNTASYCVNDNKADDSWQATQLAYTKVLQENCRQIAVTNFQKACEMLSKEKPDMAGVQKCFRDATDKFTKMKDQVMVALGSHNTFYNKFCEEADSMMETVRFGDSVVTTNSNWGRLASMQLSLASEMPAATGVFDPAKPRPFLSKQVDEKLAKYRKVVEVKTRSHQPIETVKIFEAQNMVLSESLINTPYGREGQTLEELIVQFGGKTMHRIQNTILICSKRDFEQRSEKVRDALNSKVPIVAEEFIYDCIDQNKVAKLDKFILKSKPKIEKVSCCETKQFSNCFEQLLWHQQCTNMLLFCACLLCLFIFFSG